MALAAVTGYANRELSATYRQLTTPRFLCIFAA